MKTRMLFLLLAFLLLLSGIAYSEDIAKSAQAPGSGNSGFFVNIGYDGSYLDSKYYLNNGQDNGKTTGWLNGGDVEARFETKYLWMQRFPICSTTHQYWKMQNREPT